MLSEPLQRIGPIANMAALLRTYGVRPAEVARASAVEFTLESLSPDDRLPLSLVLGMLDKAVQASGDELFPLKLAEHYRWHHHGVIHPYIAAAPTLRQALVDFCELQRLYSTGLSIYFRNMERDFTLGFGVHAGHLPMAIHLYAMVAKIGCNSIEDMTEGAVKPCELLLPFHPPGDETAFRRFFGVPLFFNQNQCSMVLTPHDVETAMPRRDPALRARWEHEFSASAAPHAMADRVARLIRPQLLLEDPSMVGVAEALGLHPRTLRRALAAEGTTFEDVRDRVRNTIAQEFLSMTPLPVGEISAILAFSSHAAFVRAFQRWNGATPTAWRAQTGRLDHST